jgi:hypothetical protein
VDILDMESRGGLKKKIRKPVISIIKFVAVRN